MEDSRGVVRGRCSLCGCAQYSPSDGGTAGGGNWKCVSCGHAPAKHVRLGAKKTCRYPGCYQPLGFDLNTGEERPCCPQHEGYEPPDHLVVQDVESSDDSYDLPTALPTPYQPLPYSAEYDPNTLYVSDGVSGMVPPAQQLFTHTAAFADTQFFPGVQQPVNQLHAGVSTLSVGQVAQCSVAAQQACAIPECSRPRYIDEDGKIHKCCGRTHAKELERRKSQQQVQPQQLVQPGATASLPDPSGTGQPSPTPQVVPTLLPTGQRKCAIQKCQNPCFVDEAGTVHECCGFTHAMEHQRRKAIVQQKQVIKGVTHCLLPECSQLVWPFKNYCGRTHADIGQQKGLAPPAPPADPNAPKDSSLCIIPGCTAKKFSDSSSGLTHPYCGKTHAELGKKNNILPTADKQEDQCELQGCQAPKRKEGGRVHEYCCQAHAQQDAPNRDARVLSDMTTVRKFLDGFPKLKGYTITENDHAKPPSGKLFGKFKQRWNALPNNQRMTCLAFHGTPERNISNICQNGYDPKLRSGQAYGKGEYFATTPDIPISYCSGGKKMLLNELLLGQHGTHHTKHSSIIVMKDTDHDLPRFIVTFP